MRGIQSYAAYVPYRRLERKDIAAFFGGAPGRGQRAVASFDEDTTTMAVEAARLALRSAGGGVARRAVVRHRGAGLPGEDERDGHPRRVASRSRGAGDGRRTAPCGPASGALRAALRRHRPGAGRHRRHPRAACPPGPTSARAATAAAALLVGDDARPGGDRRVPRRGVGERGVPRPLAHARRLDARGGGRSASARPSTCRWPTRRGSRAEGAGAAPRGGRRSRS